MEVKKLFDYSVGDNLEIYVLIKSAEARMAKNGKQFIAFNFADRSGEISAKFWDASAEDIAAFQTGKVVFLRGKRETYQDNPQIKIFNLRIAQDNEPNNPTDYLQTAPETRTEMEAEFKKFILKITEPNWNRIVRHMLNQHHEDFFEFPAAKKNHHAYAGGLAYHTLSILRLAQTIVEQYPEVNASLLYAGAILHDLGKTQELSGALGTTYTLAGNLIGHIVLIDEEIFETCKELHIDPESESVLLLRHVILAHHGLLEYGSPVRPRIMEAEILHQLDNIDASIQMMKTTLEHTEPGEFSERIFGLDNRQFYRPQQ